jgi:ABC-type bacteriocin/lantibiotic exporter with double-glycine peptidase domain
VHRAVQEKGCGIKGDIRSHHACVIQTGRVGESGSGKSTLAKLLVHFYDVSGG